MGAKNTDIVKYFQRAVDEKWGYVWSLNGTLYTKAIAESFKATKRSTSVSRSWKTYWTKDCARWFGKMCADCSGGIVGAIRSTGTSYADRNAATFKKEFTEYGKIKTLPEIPGLALWYSGHIGIYEGNGYALEFRGTEYGCVRTKVADRKWKYWGKIKGVEYEDTNTAWIVTRLLKITIPRLQGNDVRELQRRLNANGCNCGDVDGIFGSKTKKAVKAYQKKKGLTIDGKAGKNTITALGGYWRE